MLTLPYSTSDTPGIGGVIKQRPEDFFVQELPLYEPSGEGEHVYCEIQKIRLTTFDAIDRLAGALRVHPRDIGYAGMKDAQAVSRQLFSILGTTEQKVMDLHLPDMTVQWAARHGNKLRLGHLAGNRFAIKIRQVTPTDVVKVIPLLRRMEEHGMPNFFGEQRFGRRGNNHLLGAAQVSGDNKALLHHLLGAPDKTVDDPATFSARTAFDAGEFEKAMKLYPRRSGMERRLLARLVKTRKPGAAAQAVDEKLRRLWISALQSSLFNEIVAKRMTTLGTILPGDLALKHENGAVFLVTDAAAEQPRAAAFEISPTGPLLGYRMTMPEGEALRIEQEILDSHHIKPGDFRVEGRLKVKGARRALRVKPLDVEVSAGVDEHGSYIVTAFTLPPGSFATVLLREVMKSDTITDESESESHELPAEHE